MTSPPGAWEPWERFPRTQRPTASRRVEAAFSTLLVFGSFYASDEKAAIAHLTSSAKDTRGGEGDEQEPHSEWITGVMG